MAAIHPKRVSEGYLITKSSGKEKVESHQKMTEILSQTGPKRITNTVKSFCVSHPYRDDVIDSLTLVCGSADRFAVGFRNPDMGAVTLET